MRNFLLVLLFISLTHAAQAQNSNYLASYLLSPGVTQNVSTSTPLPVGVYGGSSATSGNVLTSNGPGVLATFQPAGGGGGGVTSFSGGTTGLTPATATTGVVTLGGVLSVANGGTGNGAFTAGSVVFDATGGTLSQNNANFFWDNTNLRLGIGTSAPVGALDVRSGTQTTAVPAINVTQTWNNSTTTFDGGIVENITNTASNSASSLLDLKVGGTSMVSVRQDGFISAPSATIGNTTMFIAFGQAVFITTGVELGTTAGGNVNYNTNKMTFGATVASLSQIGVSGNMAIGTSYYSTTAAPTNGLTVQGAVGIGTSVPGTGLALDVSGATRAAQLIGGGSSPTIAAGAGAGIAPTVSVAANSTNMAGVLNITTGTVTTSGSTLATITFNGTLSTAPQGCIIEARNSATAGQTGLVFTTAPSTTTWTIGVGASALTASTAYVWSYVCM